MGLFRKKGKLKREYDDKLMTLMIKQKKQWENSRRFEAITIEEHPRSLVQKKMQKAKYFYLFKEARIRRIEGNYLD